MKTLLQNHNEEMEKELNKKFFHGIPIEEMGTNQVEEKELISFLLANNEKLAQAITAELIKKIEEAGIDDGKPHDDTMELHNAIAWQDGYNTARQAMLSKAREVLN